MMTTDILLTGLPVNLHAERLILGSILLNHAKFDGIAGVLSGEDFSLEKHRRIYARMTEIWQRGESIDRVTLANELQSHNQLQSIDGLTYLVSLDEGMPELPNIDSYVRIVRDKAIKRRAIFMHQRAIEELVLDADDASDVLAKAERAISDLRVDGAAKSSFLAPAEIIAQAGGIDQFLSPKSLAGIPTPWAGLNSILTGSGFSAGQLVVIGGRPGSGKTSVAANMAMYAVQCGVPVRFVSLEMTSQDILRRMVCARAQVNMNRVAHKDLSELERFEIARALDELSGAEGPLLEVWDRQSATVLALRGELRRAAAVGRIGMVIVDYLQLMETVHGAKSDRNRTEQISEISRGLKLLAMELKCPVIALSQLSRESEKQDRQPRLSDLRDSGSIEQDADIVIFPYYKPVDPLPDVVEYSLLVAKQRNGPLGQSHLKFYRKFTRFEE